MFFLSDDLGNSISVPYWKIRLGYGEITLPYGVCATPRQKAKRQIRNKKNAPPLIIL